MIDKAACRFCGQINMIDGAVDENEAEEQATLGCKCDGARVYRQRKERIEKAKDNIELALCKIDQEVCEYLKGCTELVERGRIGTITIDTGNGIKCTVKSTNKGTIKVVKKISKDVIYDE